MCFFGNSNAAGDAARDARFAEADRQGRINAAVGGINTDFGRFNDDFYNQRSSAYTDYATPQLEEQYQGARNNLTFALARGGMLNSSVAAERQAALRTQYDRQRQAIIDQGLTLANQARGDVANSREALITQAQSAADPGSIAATSGQRVEVLANPQQFQPLSDLFTNAATGLAAANRTSASDILRNALNKNNTYGTPSLNTKEQVR